MNNIGILFINGNCSVILLSSILNNFNSSIVYIREHCYIYNIVDCYCEDNDKELSLVSYVKDGQYYTFNKKQIWYDQFYSFIDNVPDKVTLLVIYKYKDDDVNNIFRYLKDRRIFFNPIITSS